MGLINEQNSKRVEWIDTAKGIGLILVILGHLKIDYLSAWIYTFHMPLFFFLSGVVFSGHKMQFESGDTKGSTSKIGIAIIGAGRVGVSFAEEIRNNLVTAYSQNAL